MNRFYCNASLVLLVIFCLSGVFTFSSFAQKDDSLQVKVFSDDDLDGNLYVKNKLVSSANRLVANPDDLAQEIIIISGDDIRKFGYATLVDVLKTIPGFRTSQPGNAIEGETFLMRGLYGNDHTKILINGIPIKPEAVKGMPIAAQLPIRHAEFIEIVLGPASASYGSDAMAGVINIVFPEIDRPVFAWADVNLTTPQSTEFNLTLGGKSGKGKNVLNYEIFASSQRATDVNLALPNDSIRFDPQSLSPIQNQLLITEEDDPTLPETNQLKRESRLFGTYLKYRWFELNVTAMYREEHSAFGYSPLTSAYSDPGTTFGENINSFSLKYHDVKEKRYQSFAAISALHYRTIENSGYLAIDDPLSIGRNSSYARSLDLRGEYTGTLKLNKSMRLALGSTITTVTSHPFTTYLARPFRPQSDGFALAEQDMVLETAAANPLYDSLVGLDSTVWLETYVNYSLAGFVHFLYTSQSGKFNLELGTRMDLNGDELVFTPKIGLVYRPVNKLKFTLYGGQGHRAPRSYHLYNNYYTTLSDWNNGGSMKRVLDTIMTSELLTGLDARIIWKVSDKWELSGRYYGHFMDNRVIREVIEEPDSMMGPPTPQMANMPIGYRYFNGNAQSFLGATLISLNYEGAHRKFNWDVSFSYEYARGWEYVEKEENAPETVEQLSDYRYMPRHAAKLNVRLSRDKLTFSMNGQYYGNYISEIYRENSTVDYDYMRNYFFNLDVMMHYKIFRQLGVFVGGYNILNTVQSGIPSSTVTTTWAFNPQYGRLFRIGLNFQLN